MQANSRVALGPVVCQCLSVHQEMQPPVSTSLAVATNNTARQEVHLDAQRDTVETKTPTDEDKLARQIKTQVNGSWVG